MKWWQIGKRDADLERELQSDLQLEEEEQRERGIAPEEARYAALRAFGNPTVISEQTREVWSWDRLKTLLRDLRITIRTLARQPGFSAVAMLVIAVGMGATISLFTVVWSVLLKPLPFDHPEQLVRLYESSERFPANVVCPRHLRRMETREPIVLRSRALSRLAAVQPVRRRCAARTGPCNDLFLGPFRHARRPAPHRTLLHGGGRPAFRQRYRHPQLVSLEAPLRRRLFRHRPQNQS